MALQAINPNFSSGIATAMSNAQHSVNAVGSISDKYFNKLQEDEDRAYNRGRQKVIDDRALLEDAHKATLWGRQEAARDNALIAQNTATEDNFNALKLDRHYTQGGAGDKALLAYMAKNQGGAVSATDALRIYNEAEQGKSVPVQMGPLLSRPSKTGGMTGGTAPVYKTVTTPSGVNPAGVVHAPGSKLLFRPDDVAPKPFVPSAGPLERTLEMFSPAKTQKEQLKAINASKLQENQYNGKLSQKEFNKLSPAEQTAYVKAAVSLLPQDAQVGVNGFLTSMKPTTKREMVRAGTSGSSHSGGSTSYKGYTQQVPTGLVEQAYKDVYAAIPKDEKADVQAYHNLLSQVVGRGGTDGGGSTAQEVGLAEILKNSIGTGEASDKDKAIFEITKAKASDNIKQANENARMSLEERKMSLDHSDKMAAIAAGRESKKDEGNDLWKDARQQKAAVWQAALSDAQDAVKTYRAAYAKDPTDDNRKRLNQALGYLRQIQ